MPSLSPKQSLCSPNPVLNLPPADDPAWKVTRNYDRYTSKLPSVVVKEQPKFGFPERMLQKIKNAQAVAKQAKLRSLAIRTMTTYPRGDPPMPAGPPRDIIDERLSPSEIASIRLRRGRDFAQARIDGMNGAAGAMNGTSNLPIHAGQQMDLNFIYSKVLELSEQLKANREQTQGIIAGAEELAHRAATTGRVPGIHDANSQILSSRIADLTHKLSESESMNKTLLREQRENGKLIGEYEQALEKVVAMLRDFAHNKEIEKCNLAKQYLSTLQAERDEHLTTRLEKDAANSVIFKLMAQMRHAHRLAVEESCPEIEVVSGLQNEVRSLRNALGLPKEKFEEETGYTILKDVRGGTGEEDD